MLELHGGSDLAYGEANARGCLLSYDDNVMGVLCRLTGPHVDRVDRKLL